MSAGRSFKMAVKAAADETEEEVYEPITYTFEEESEPDENDEVEVTVNEITMNWPGRGALTLMIADSSENQTGAIMAMLKKALSPNDMRFIRAGLGAEKITLQQVQEMVMDAVEQWTTFPTKRRPASTPSQRSTGTRSTGRSPGAGSTRSTSSRAASSRTS